MNQKEIETASFDELLTGFLQFLKKEKSYKHSTLRTYYTYLHKLKLYMGIHGIDSYTPDVGLEYYEMYLIEHNLTILSQKTMLTIINRLNTFSSGEEYGVQRNRCIDLLPEEYELALELHDAKCYEKGNKEITVKKKNHISRHFLKDCIKWGCTNIQQLHASQVTRACLGVRNKNSWEVVREFLKFLAEMDITESDLSVLVPHCKRAFKVPITYTVDEISKVLDVIDRSTGKGKRDYAMLLMATRLGMRSSDIRNTTLDDLECINDKLFFTQQKTGEGHELLLLPEIKEALEDYISNGRPNTQDSKVFIRTRAPYQGLTAAGLHSETTKYFRAAGIDFTGKKHGPHTFRSSMASSMVNDSVPYEAVSKILGHSDPNVIKHYAKLNIEMLRQCAIEVPEPSGKFKEFLQGGGLLC